MNHYLDYLRDLIPLLLSRVNTSRVVCTSVKQNDRVLGGSLIYKVLPLVISLFHPCRYQKNPPYLDVFKHAVDVKAIGVLVKIGVLFNFETRVLEDGKMVTPSRVGNVDLLGVGIEGVKESSTNTESTSA